MVAHEESTGAKSGDGLGPEISDFLNTYCKEKTPGFIIKAHRRKNQFWT
jgi:hypothetical protein